MKFFRPIICRLWTSKVRIHVQGRLIIPLSVHHGHICSQPNELSQTAMCVKHLINELWRQRRDQEVQTVSCLVSDLLILQPKWVGLRALLRGPSFQLHANMELLNASKSYQQTPPLSTTRDFTNIQIRKLRRQQLSKPYLRSADLRFRIA